MLPDARSGASWYCAKGPSLPIQGATGEKKQCTYVLYLARTELVYTYDDVIFFIAFLSSPYRETPKNAIKKIGKGEKK
jgi:hypothetical protein